MSDDEQTTETIGEESQTQEESNYSDVDSNGGGTDDNLRNFGGAIAVCGLLILFGGTTFAIWGVSTESSMFGMSSKTEIKMGAQEVEVRAEIDGESESETDEYDGGGDVESFFSNLRIMLYVLVICGAALAYMGHSGEKMEFAPKTIAVAASLSVIILIYVFMSLPNAYEEDTELFEALDEDPAYFFSDDGFETTFGLGMLLPLASLGICGYMIKDRGITLEDIKG